MTWTRSAEIVLAVAVPLLAIIGSLLALLARQLDHRYDVAVDIPLWGVLAFAGVAGAMVWWWRRRRAS